MLCDKSLRREHRVQPAVEVRVLEAVVCDQKEETVQTQDADDAWVRQESSTKEKIRREKKVQEGCLRVSFYDRFD